MAYDKVVDSARLDLLLTNVANAIREKTGTTEKLSLTAMPASIQSITVGSGDVEVSDDLVKDIDRTILSIEMPAEHFGNYSFADAVMLNTVTNTDGVNSYGKYSFYNCYSLTSFGDTNTPTIRGTGHVYIGEHAFDNAGLSSITIDHFNGASIGAHAFSNSEIRYFILNGPDGTEVEVGPSSFAGTPLDTVAINGDQDVSVGSFAFDGTNLEAIDLNKVIQLGEASCRSTDFTSLSIPANVSLANGYVNASMVGIPTSTNSTGVFANCDKLITVTSDTDISNCCFFGCDVLSSFSLSDTVDRLGSYAFAYCLGLKSIELAFTVKTIGYSPFYGSGVETAIVDAIHISGNNVNVLCGMKELVTATINNETPLDSYDIADRTFYECEKLTNLTLDTPPYTVGASAFEYCSLLPDQDWISSVDSIGDYAFAHCNSFKNVTVTGTQDIEYTAFYQNTLDTLTAQDRYEVNTFGAVVDKYIITGNDESAVITMAPARSIEHHYSDDVLDAVESLQHMIKGYSVSVQLPATTRYDASDNITELVLPTYANVSSNCFSYAKHLERLTGTDCVSISIGEDAFYHCSKALTVTLTATDGITIGVKAFDRTDISLSLNAGGDVRINGAAFQWDRINECHVAGHSIYIGASAFHYAAFTGAIDFDVQGGAFTIDYNAFQDTSFNTPLTITGAHDVTIGDFSFWYSSVSNIDITMTGTLTIGDYAFASSTGAGFALSCTGSIDDAFIGDDAFHPSAIKVFELSSYNTITIGDRAFNSSDLNNCVLTSDKITVGMYAFAYNYDLTNCALNANSELTIDIGGFIHTSIANFPVSLSTKAVSIGDSAFERCNKLLPYIEFADDWKLGSFVFKKSSVQYAFNVPMLTHELFESSALKYVVPSTVCHDMADRAVFTESLKALYVPNGTTTVNNIVPSRTDAGLFILSIPDSVSNISNNVFTGTVITKKAVGSYVDDEGEVVTLYEDVVNYYPTMANMAGMLRLPKNAKVTAPENYFSNLTAIDFGNSDQMAILEKVKYAGESTTPRFIAIPADTDTLVGVTADSVPFGLVVLKNGCTKTPVLEGASDVELHGSVNTLSTGWCPAVTSKYVYIPDGVTTIESNALPSLAEVITLPEGLQTISNNAFPANSAVKTVYALCSASALEASTVFSNCPNLQDIYVAFAPDECEGPWGAPDSCRIHYTSAPLDIEDDEKWAYLMYVFGGTSIYRFCEIKTDTGVKYIKYRNPDEVEANEPEVSMYQDAETGRWYVDVAGEHFYVGLGESPEIACWAPVFEKMDMMTSDTPISVPAAPPMIIKQEGHINTRAANSLIVKATEDGTTVSIEATKEGFSIDSMKYRLSTASSTDYTSYTLGESIVLEHAGDYVEFQSNTLNTSIDGGCRLTASADVELGGVLSALVGGNTTCPDNAFTYFFSECPITTAPTLGFKQVGRRCFQYMFENCTKLTKAPVLYLDDKLVDGRKAYAYEGMFKGCTALVDARGIFKMCYFQTGASMFEGCTSLLYVDDIVFDNDMNLRSMFKGCTSLLKTPAIRSTSSSIYANNMFEGCTSLTEVSDIFVTSWVGNCLSDMFKDCVNLKTVRTSFEKWADYVTCTNWLAGAPAEGVFYRNSKLPIIRGENYIPEGWAVLPVGMEFDDYEDRYVTVRLHEGMTGTEQAPICVIGESIKTSDNNMTRPMIRLAADSTLTADFGLTILPDGRVVGTVKRTVAVNDAYYDVEAYMAGQEDAAETLQLHISYSTILVEPLDTYELVDNQSSDYVTYTKTESVVNGLPVFAGDDGTYLMHPSPLYSTDYWWVVDTLDVDYTSFKPALFITNNNSYHINMVNVYLSSTNSENSNRFKICTPASVLVESSIQELAGRYNVSEYVLSNQATGKALNPTFSGITYTDLNVDAPMGISWRMTANEADYYTKCAYTDGPSGAWSINSPEGDAADIKVTILKPFIMLGYTIGYYQYCTLLIQNGTLNEKPLYQTVLSGGMKPYYVYYNGTDWCLNSNSLDEEPIAVADSRMWTPTAPWDTLKWNVTSDLYERVCIFSTEGAVSGPRTTDVITDTAAELIERERYLSFVARSSDDCDDCADNHQYVDIVYKLYNTDMLKYNVSPIYYTYSQENNGLGKYASAFGEWLLFDYDAMTWVTCCADGCAEDCYYNPLAGKADGAIGYVAKITGDAAHVAPSPTDDNVYWTLDACFEYVRKYPGTIFTCGVEYVGYDVYNGKSVGINVPTEHIGGVLLGEPSISGSSYGLSLRKTSNNAIILEGTVAGAPVGESVSITVNYGTTAGGSYTTSVKLNIEPGTYVVEHWNSATNTKYLTTLDRLEDNPEESAQAAVDRMNAEDELWNPYQLYDADVMTKAEAEAVIESKGYEVCSVGNYKMKKGPYSVNYYAYSYCSGGTKSYGANYYYSDVPAPSMSAIYGLSNKCNDSSFCYLWITGYYQSQYEAFEALNFESGSCSCSNTAAAAYEEDTPDDLK